MIRLLVSDGFLRPLLVEIFSGLGIGGFAAGESIIADPVDGVIGEGPVGDGHKVKHSTGLGVFLPVYHSRTISPPCGIPQPLLGVSS